MPSTTIDVATLAGVEVKTLDRMADLADLVRAFRSIWGFAEGAAPVSAELLRAFQFAGGYVAGAFADGRLVGGSAGFLGRHPGEERLHLHSHMSGVLPVWQGRHVGLVLKQHQRAWALSTGIEIIEWTFDPLVRRNAFFNLAKLGARIVGFEPNFYGEMNDATNKGDESDRALVRWMLTSPSAPGDPDQDGRVILRPDGEGRPVVEKGDGDVLRAWIPEDAVGLRQDDPANGRAWRLALRETVGAAIADGWEATSMSRDGWYTLVRAGA